MAEYRYYTVMTERKDNGFKWPGAFLIKEEGYTVEKFISEQIETGRWSEEQAVRCEKELNIWLDSEVRPTYEWSHSKYKKLVKLCFENLLNKRYEEATIAMKKARAIEKYL